MSKIMKRSEIHDIMKQRRLVEYENNDYPPLFIKDAREGVMYRIMGPHRFPCKYLYVADDSGVMFSIRVTPAFEVKVVEFARSRGVRSAIGLFLFKDTKPILNVNIPIWNVTGHVSA